MKRSLTFLFILLSFSLKAQEKTYVGELSYNASDSESKLDCRVKVTKELQSKLLQEAGVYVVVESKLSSSENREEFSQDFLEEIITLTAGITKFVNIDETWNGEVFWMKASITIDEAHFEESLNQLIFDKKKEKKLAEIERENEALKKENKEIKSVNFDKVAKEVLAKQREDEKARQRSRLNRQLSNNNNVISYTVDLISPFNLKFLRNSARPNSRISKSYTAFYLGIKFKPLKRMPYLPGPYEVDDSGNAWYYDTPQSLKLGPKTGEKNGNVFVNGGITRMIVYPIWWSVGCGLGSIKTIEGRSYVQPLNMPNGGTSARPGRLQKGWARNRDRTGFRFYFETAGHLKIDNQFLVSLGLSLQSDDALQLDVSELKAQVGLGFAF